MNRRGFLKGVGATSLALAGGWLNIKDKTVLASAGVSIEERDEKWALKSGEYPVHVIEMSIPFENPTILFIDSENDNRRILVPRHTEEEMRWVGDNLPPRPEPLDGILRTRMDLLYGNLKEQIPADKIHLNHIIARTPKGTEHAIVAYHRPLPVNLMVVQVPAPFLFA